MHSIMRVYIATWQGLLSTDQSQYKTCKEENSYLQLKCSVHTAVCIMHEGSTASLLRKSYGGN